MSSPSPAPPAGKQRSELSSIEGSQSRFQRQRVSVGLCHVQTSEQRFGSQAVEDIKTWLAETPQQEEELTDEESDDEDDEVQPTTTEADNSSIVNEDHTMAELNGNEANYYYEHEDVADTPDLLVEPHYRPSHSGGDAPPTFPKLARLRVNLTGLSQRYNLYFTAYQDKIYVYQPSNGVNILPSPSVILRPERSKQARRIALVGSVIDRINPHQINHVKVGELGNLEVLLFSYDDGDVMAYYTQAFVRYIEACDVYRAQHSRTQPRPAPPQQFFHENVGSSAWGLALHKQSRLLAVSSNSHEVTVFAFSTCARNRHSPFQSTDPDHSPIVWSGHTASQLEKHFQCRTRTWRIVLFFGPDGNNCPSLDFLDDETGNAEKVVAFDIYGNTWFLDIWKIGVAPMNYTRSANRGNGRPFGWGCLVLPRGSFKPTRTCRDTLGLARAHVMNQLDRGHTPGTDNWWDTTCSLFYINDLAADPRQYLRQRGYRFYVENYHKHSGEELRQACDEDVAEDDDGDDSASEVDSRVAMGGQGPARTDWDLVMKASAQHKEVPEGARIDEEEEKRQGFAFSRTIIPAFGQTLPVDGSKYDLPIYHGHGYDANVTRRSLFKAVPHTKTELPQHVTRNFCLLLTTMTDVELHPLDFKSVGIICRHVLVYHNHRRARPSIPFDMAVDISERASLLCHVPELNVVAVGSLTGRVALLTLTRNGRARPAWDGPRFGFRVDCVLPRKQEENARLRPWATLHGMAMSPDPETTGTQGLALRGGPGARRWAPTRYRLILHYADHTILKYSITRTDDDVESELLIF